MKKGCTHKATKTTGAPPPPPAAATTSAPVTRTKRKVGDRSPELAKAVPQVVRVNPAVRRFPLRNARPVGDPIPHPNPPRPTNTFASLPRTAVFPPPRPTLSPANFSPPSTSRSVPILPPPAAIPLVMPPPPPASLPSRSLRPTVSSPTIDLLYENRLLQEQLIASQEDLRLTREQLTRERSRADRMVKIYQERITQLQGSEESDAAGPPSSGR